MNLVVFYVNPVRRGARRMEHNLVNSVVSFPHQTVHVRTTGAHINRQLAGTGFLRSDDYDDM